MRISGSNAGYTFSEVVWRVQATHSIRQFPFISPPACHRAPSRFNLTLLLDITQPNKIIWWWWWYYHHHHYYYHTTKRFSKHWYLHVAHNTEKVIKPANSKVFIYIIQINNIYVGYSESKYCLRICLVHSQDSLCARAVISSINWEATNISWNSCYVYVCSLR